MLPLFVSCLYITLNFLFLFFFFNDTATTEIYTLSLHDALPISESILFSVGDPLKVRDGDNSQSLHLRGAATVLSGRFFRVDVQY